MVKVTYENDENGQKMFVTLAPSKDEGFVDMKIEFDPEAEDGTEDPYGVIGKLLHAFSPNNPMENN